MPAYPDAMPVDISFVFESERPAGNRGFVKAVGEDLRFEDGTLARFWGVNFNGGACFGRPVAAEVQWWLRFCSRCHHIKGLSFL